MLTFDKNNAGYMWKDYYDVNPKLTSAGWHELFNSSDLRSKLKWKNELANATTKMVNFFSSTEEVLRKYEDDNLVCDGAGTGLAFYAWAKQEKLKGRRFDVTKDLGGATSDYAGWRYSDSYRHEEKKWVTEGQGTVMKTFYTYYTPAEAANISDEELRKKPFFEIGGRGFFDGPSLEWLLDGSDEDVKINGTQTVLADFNPNTPDAPNTRSSVLKLELIKFDNFKDYDSGNDNISNHVTMRDFLLAHAIPATTLPMGANSCTLASNNIDMSKVAKADGTGGCQANVYKLDANGNQVYDLNQKPIFEWPRLEENDKNEKQPSWWHSDYKDLPYQFTYPFYQKIVNLIK